MEVKNLGGLFMIEIVATKENIQNIDIKETVVVYSESEKICNGSYIDILPKIKQLGFSCNDNEVLNHIQYGSNGVEMKLGNKVFTLWNGNTKKFSITRLM